MIKEQKIYLRKKGDRFVFETKIKNKTIHLINLPTNYNKFLKEISRLIQESCLDCKKLTKSSFFSVSKWVEIDRKMQSADYKSQKKIKGSSKIRTT